MNAFDVRVKCDTPRDLGIGICEMSGYLNDFSDDDDDDDERECW